MGHGGNALRSPQPTAPMKTIHVTPEVEIYPKISRAIGLGKTSSIHVAAIARSSINYPLGTLAIVEKSAAETVLLGTIESGTVYLELMDRKTINRLLCEIRIPSEVSAIVRDALTEDAQ